MKTRVVLAGIALLLATAGRAQQAQKTLMAEGGGPDDRASARVLYWNLKVNEAAGQFAFNYGRPVWKKAYEDSAGFDAMTKGKIWRMGSNFWTNLVTDLPINIAGKDVPPGMYYLGLLRSADGAQWSLAFINPEKCRAGHLDAFQIQRAAVEFTAPMTKVHPEPKAQKLTITLSHPPDDIKNVTLKVAWGNLALSAPIQVTLNE